MCLQVPGKAVALDAKKREAIVAYGSERRIASTALLPVKKGEYVLVRNHMIIQKIPKADAERVLEAIRGRD